MKSFVHSILALLFLNQAISTTVILVNFELNREEIAKTLCEKKEEEDNCCQGSCHLKKQLQAEEKKQEAPQQSQKQLKQFPLFYEKRGNWMVYASSNGEQTAAPYLCSLTHPFSLSVFHPPCYAA